MKKISAESSITCFILVFIMMFAMVLNGMTMYAQSVPAPGYVPLEFEGTDVNVSPQNIIQPRGNTPLEFFSNNNNAVTYTIHITGLADSAGAYISTPPTIGVPSTTTIHGVTSNANLIINPGTRAGYTFSHWTYYPIPSTMYVDNGIFDRENGTISGNNGRVRLRIQHDAEATFTFTAHWTIHTGSAEPTPPAVPMITTDLAVPTVPADPIATAIPIIPPIPPAPNTRTLTVHAGRGGIVAININAPAPVNAAHIVPGTIVTIRALPFSGFSFNRWVYSSMLLRNIRHETATFVMPNHDVEFWADFTDYRYRGRYWVDPHAPFPTVPDSVPAYLPAEPRPMPAPVAPDELIPLMPELLEPEPEDELIPLVPEIIPRTVNINGSPLASGNQPSATINGVTMIPVADVFRALGYRVHWDSAAGQATLTRGTVTIVITNGSRQFTVNNGPRNLRAPAEIVNGRLMVPFVEIIESVGGRAHLDARGAINIFMTR